MRVSIPGQNKSKRVLRKRIEKRNLKSDSQSELQMDKKQPTNPHHDPNYNMQYQCSRRTGRKCGGYFYNPPAFCESPRIEVDDLGDSWVQVYFCKTKRCPRWVTGTCPAKNLPKIEYVDGLPVFDEPATRKPKRVERRRTTKVSAVEHSTSQQTPRKRRRVS